MPGIGEIKMNSVAILEELRLLKTEIKMRYVSKQAMFGAQYLKKLQKDHREIKNSFRPFKNKSPTMAMKITFIGCSLCASSPFSTSPWIILYTFRTNEVGTVIICAYQIKLRKINCLEWKSPAPRRPDNNKHIHQSYLSKEQNGFLPLPEGSIRMKTATASRKKRQPDWGRLPGYNLCVGSPSRSRIIGPTLFGQGRCHTALDRQW